MGFVRGGRADPREALGRRIALGSVAGIEEGVEAQHAIVRCAAAAGTDGNRSRVAAAVGGAGQGRNKVLPDLVGWMDVELSVARLEGRASGGTRCGRGATRTVRRSGGAGIWREREINA